jgi:hypothetical protein
MPYINVIWFIGLINMNEWIKTSTACLSTGGMKCDILMFRGKNRLSQDLHLMFSVGHMKKYCGFSYATAFTSRQLQFSKQTVLL